MFAGRTFGWLILFFFSVNCNADLRGFQFTSIAHRSLSHRLVPSLLLLLSLSTSLVMDDDDNDNDDGRCDTFQIYFSNAFSYATNQNDNGTTKKATHTSQPTDRLNVQSSIHNTKHWESKKMYRLAHC